MATSHSAGLRKVSFGFSISVFHGAISDLTSKYCSQNSSPNHSGQNVFHLTKTSPVKQLHAVNDYIIVQSDVAAQLFS